MRTADDEEYYFIPQGATYTYVDESDENNNKTYLYVDVDRINGKLKIQNEHFGIFWQHGIYATDLAASHYAAG